MTFVERLRLKLRFKGWGRLRANSHAGFNLSHSQVGEDMVINAFTGGRRTGFFVDVGAYHPVFFSNTYHFYCKGWRGLNIDARPGVVELFNLLRPGDVNLQLCLSPVDGQEVDYYAFDNAAYNTIDPEMARRALALPGVRLMSKHRLRTLTLTRCLDEYVPPGVPIDLLTIDVEGMDEAILMSNDWDRYRPGILVFEQHDVSLRDVEECPLMKHLGNLGYELVAKCGPSLILTLRTTA